MIATIVFPFVLFAQLIPQSSEVSYSDVVKLQNQALQLKGEPLRLAHKDSIKIAESLGRPRLLAVLFQRLGRTLERSNVQDAVIAYESALRALKADKTLNAEAELARLFRIGKGLSRSRYANNADLYAEALNRDLEKAETDKMLMAGLLVDIGNAYFAQPQFAVAMGMYEAALARPEIGSNPRLRAYALSNLGECLRRQGKLQEAEQRLQEAFGILGQNVDATDSRRAFLMLAGIQIDRGQIDKALDTSTKALALYARAKDVEGEARAYAVLGGVHLRKKHWAEATESYGRAIKQGLAPENEWSLWPEYLGLGRARRGAGDSIGAIDALRSSLDNVEDALKKLTTDEGKVTLLDSARGVFDELISLLLDSSGDLQESSVIQALAVAERSKGAAMRALTVAERQRFNCPVNSRQSLQTQKAIGVRSGSRDPRCTVERKLGTATPAPLARLVFHALVDRLVVFGISSRGEIRVHISPTGLDALAGRVSQFRRDLGVDLGGRGVTVVSGTEEKPSEAYHAGSQALYSDLIKPMESLFPNDEAIVIEPDGPLWLVPFAALEDTSGKPLIDRWQILYSPSAETLDEIRKEPTYRIPQDLKALIVGNPTAPKPTNRNDDPFRGGSMRATFDPLPGAEKEARLIHGMLPSNQSALLIGNQATLESLKAKAPASTLIHLASHALAFPEKPLASFVMLAPANGSDGRLTAREVIDLKFPIEADLVTLSACQTGLGYLSGDGVIGLSRSFLAMGSRSVMVSQWSVSDTATAALMESFYERYFSGKEDKARSLQQAMKSIRVRPGLGHPKFWASFVLIGSER